jgi:hypothetical protein
MKLSFLFIIVRDTTKHESSFILELLSSFGLMIWNSLIDESLVLRVDTKYRQFKKCRINGWNFQSVFGMSNKRLF